MTTEPLHLLTDLQIEEASLVDKGDNPEAHIALFKRDVDLDDDMHDEEKAGGDAAKVLRLLAKLPKPIQRTMKPEIQRYMDKGDYKTAIGVLNELISANKSMHDEEKACTEQHKSGTPCPTCGHGIEDDDDEMMPAGKSWLERLKFWSSSEKGKPPRDLDRRFHRAAGKLDNIDERKRKEFDRKYERLLQSNASEAEWKKLIVAMENEISYARKGAEVIDAFGHEVAEALALDDPFGELAKSVFNLERSLELDPDDDAWAVVDTIKAALMHEDREVFSEAVQELVETIVDSHKSAGEIQHKGEGKVVYRDRASGYSIWQYGPKHFEVLDDDGDTVTTRRSLADAKSALRGKVGKADGHHEVERLLGRVLGRLPEDQRAEVRSKVEALQRSGKYGEALRLLRQASRFYKSAGEIQHNGHEATTNKEREMTDTMLIDDVLKGLPEDQRALVENYIDSEISNGTEPVEPEKTEGESALEKRLQETEAALAKMVEEKRNAEFVGKARDMKLPGIEVEKLGSILKRCHDVSEELYADVEAAFKAMSAQAKRTGFMFAEVGKAASVGAADMPGDDRLEKRAREIAKADGMSFEQAYVKALEENPEAYLASIGTSLPVE